MANLATIADRRRMRIERIAQRRLRREFGRFARVASESPRRLNLITQTHRERIQAILAAAYEVSILLGVELSEVQLAKSRKQDETTEALIDRLMREWVEERAFRQATSIADRSRGIAQRALEEGINEGMGEAELARSIRRAVGGLSRARSLTIARTETHGAMNNAGGAAAEDLGATTKEWVAIEDTRTRETHRQADGQTVPINDKFNVGGAALRYPGDPSAGAPGETINCRCAMAYA